MNDVFRMLLLAACLSACSERAQAADLSKLSEADRKQVNAWMSQRAETLVEAHRMDEEVRQAWTDTRHSSPEVDALRRKYRELQQALLQTQEEIQKKVLEVPAIQDKVKKLEQVREKEKALSKMISEKTGE